MKKETCRFSFRFYFVLFSLFIVPELVSAQKAIVTGQIFDEISRKPIPDVNVFIAGSNRGATTDKDGKFVIENVATGKRFLIADHIAYTQKRIPIFVKQKGHRKLTVFLSPKILTLDNVVFTASRHAETQFQSQKDIAVATEKEIAVRISPNTADALRETPGILVQKTTAGHGAPIIRGMIGKDVLLLYNGIRLNKPTFRFGANQYMNTIDVESLNRIEVTKGPGSVMYGSDAIGGVVNMISEPPQFLEQDGHWQSTFSTRYGSADQSRIIHTGFTNRFGKMIVKSGITWKKIDDLRAGAQVGPQVPTGYDEMNGNVKIGVSLSESSSLDFDLLAVNQKQVPRYDKYVSGKYQKYLYDPQNRYLSSITLYSRPQKMNRINSLQWNVSYQFEEEGSIQQKTGKTSITKNRNDLTTLGSFLQLNSVLRSRHILTYGYEIYRDRVNSSRFKNSVRLPRGNFPNGSTYRSLGIFANDNIIFTEKFDCTVGLRWSRMHISSLLEEPFGNFEDHYSDLTGTLGLSYKPKPWLNLIAAYAKGFRAPNFNDAVVLKVANAGVDAPSPGLAPEKSHNFEMGVKVNRPGLNGSAFVFYNRLIDLIDRYLGTYQGLRFFDENQNGNREADEADIYQKRNVAKAYIAGWEVAGDYRMNAKWSLRGNVFWTYGQNITVDEPMSRIPPLMGLATVKYQETDRLSLEAFIRAARRQGRLSTRDKEDSRINPDGTPGWRTLNFRCSYNIEKNMKMYIIFGNIFDETYKEHGSGIYSPGRNFIIGLRFTS